MSVANMLRFLVAARADLLRLLRNSPPQKTGGSNKRPPSLLACSLLRKPRNCLAPDISPPLAMLCVLEANKIFRYLFDDT